MAAANEYKSAPTSPRKSDYLLDFVGGLGLNVELRPRVVCARPRMVLVCGACAKRDVRIKALQLPLDERVHGGSGPVAYFNLQCINKFLEGGSGVQGDAERGEQGMSGGGVIRKAGYIEAAFWRG